jgi:hypothetical protein
MDSTFDFGCGRDTYHLGSGPDEPDAKIRDRRNVQVGEVAFPVDAPLAPATPPFPARPAWSNPSPVMTRALLAILLISGLLAACGVNGKPEKPEGTKSNKPIVLDPLIK